LNVKDSLFSDARHIQRDATVVHKAYPVRDIVARIWRENLYPRRGRLALAVVAMLLSSATTGLMVPLIKYAVDDIFIARNMSYVYYLAAGTFFITLIKSSSSARRLASSSGGKLCASATVRAISFQRFIWPA